MMVKKQSSFFLMAETKLEKFVKKYYSIIFLVALIVWLVADSHCKVKLY